MKNLKDNNFEVPILFIIFRRRAAALKVLEAISKVKPVRFYISQDGPRNMKERGEVEETRKEILSKIDWKCDLTVWTHEKNLGLKKHIPEALDKFFEREKYGIYLEDDTLPSKEFFCFQKELLKKYENDKRIFSINGTNFYPEVTKVKDSYYLSKLGDIWGFGLWKRSWKLYDAEMKDYSVISRKEIYSKYFINKRHKFYLENFWKAIIAGKLNSWAMQLVYAAVKNNMYFISPKVNLVNNIGVNQKGSNPSLQNYHSDFGSLLPISHPNVLKYDEVNDARYFSNMLKGGWARIMLIKVYLSLPGILKKAVKNLANITFAKK